MVSGVNAETNNEIAVGYLIPTREAIMSSEFPEILTLQQAADLLPLWQAIGIRFRRNYLVLLLIVLWWARRDARRLATSS